jgi:hypothetical protein
VSGLSDRLYSGIISATIVVGGYGAFAALTVITFAAKATKLLRFSTLARLYLENTLLEGLAQDLEDMAAELGEFIQQ